MIDSGDLLKPPPTADQRPAFPVGLVDTVRNIALEPESFRELCTSPVQPTIDFIKKTYVKQATSERNRDDYRSVIDEIQSYLSYMGLGI